MTKKQIKIVCLILSVILLIIAFFQISQTYSVFYSELHGTSEIQIGKWDILVNNAQVTNGYQTNFVMNPLDFTSSPQVLDGKIAPGMSGIGEISIKPQNVDVSIRYDIFFNKSVITNIQIHISDPIVNNKIKPLIKTADDTYTGTILLSDIVTNYEDVIEFEVEWINDETNNPEDTALGINPTTAVLVPITITFSQYLGETINGI